MIAIAAGASNTLLRRCAVRALAARTGVEQRQAPGAQIIFRRIRSCGRPTARADHHAGQRADRAAQGRARHGASQRAAAGTHIGAHFMSVIVTLNGFGIASLGVSLLGASILLAIVNFCRRGTAR